MSLADGLVKLLLDPDGPDALAVKHFLDHRQSALCAECKVGRAVFRRYLWDIEPDPSAERGKDEAT